MEELFLGLDLGTTNIKAILADGRGRIVARGGKSVGIRHLPNDGAEQNIEEICSSTLAALGELKSQADVSGVRAIGISSQGGATQLLDAQQRPRGPVLSWLDGRGKDHNQELNRRMGERWFSEHIGCSASGMAVGQVLRLRQQQPQMLKDAHVAFVGDVIVGRLCGRRAHDATSLSICMMYNPQTGWADEEMLALLGLKESDLPDLLPPTTPAGRLLPAIAAQTGLPAGIPVSVAIHDQYCAALGVGAVHPGDVLFGAGTAWVLLATTDRYAPPIAGGLICTHVIPGLFGQMLSLGNGGSAITWALKLLGMGGLKPVQVDQVIAQAPVGSENLLFWPLLIHYGGAGLKPGTQGRLTGLRLSHEPPHVLRAVVEGLCMELGRYVGIWARSGITVRRLKMCGGAGNSTITPQIIADITGAEVDCMRESDTSALGGAAIARAMTEPNTPLAQISLEMAPSCRTYSAGADRQAYQQLLQRYVESLRLEML